MTMTNALRFEKNFAEGIAAAGINAKAAQAQSVVESAVSKAKLCDGAQSLLYVNTSLYAALLPIEADMLTKIGRVFGISVSMPAIAAISSFVLGRLQYRINPRILTAHTFYPVFEQYNPNAASAAELTAALGAAYTKTMVLICEGEMSAAELNTLSGQLRVKKLFKEYL